MNRHSFPNMKKLFYVLPLSFLLATLFLREIKSAEIGKADLNKLLKGQFIHQTKEVSGAPWPESTFQLYLPNIQPLEAVAVFAAYEYQKEYVPNLVRSEAVKQPTPNSVHVAYTLHLPWPLSDIEYIHEHILTQDDSNSYRVKWNLIKSSSAEKTYGEARFEPFQEGTLMTYRNFIWPSSILAPLLESSALADMKKSLEITLKQMKEIKENKPKLLEIQKRMVKESLQGKSVYQPIINFRQELKKKKNS